MEVVYTSASAFLAPMYHERARPNRARRAQVVRLRPAAANGRSGTEMVPAGSWRKTEPHVRVAGDDAVVFVGNPARLAK